MDSTEPSEHPQPIEHWSRLSAQRERSGDYLGALDAAFFGLEQHPTARDLQYRAILNLSRTGANKRARELWRRYGLQANLDKGTANADLEANIAALGARLDREEALVAAASQRRAKLQHAALHYSSIYERITSSFLGINAAVLYELCGETSRAKEIAARIVAECPRSRPRSDQVSYQLAADRAAAALLLDDLPNAN